MPEELHSAEEGILPSDALFLVNIVVNKRKLKELSLFYGFTHFEIISTTHVLLLPLACKITYIHTHTHTNTQSIYAYYSRNTYKCSERYKADLHISMLS